MSMLFHSQGFRGRRLFFAGKGGVGKTTLAVTAAVQSARGGAKTLLITTDPAAHIGWVLQSDVGEDPTPVPGVPNLDAVRINPAEETQRYQTTILEEARTRYQPATVQRMAEELRSPCTEEVAVFRRFLWALLSEDYERVVFDTAPTGHTLRLLALPVSYHQQIVVKAHGSSEGQAIVDAEAARMREAMAVLRNPAETTVVWVVYPESTPITEARRGAEDLQRIGISTGVVMANQVLPEAVCVHPLFRKRYGMQQKYLRVLHEKFPDCAIVEVPLQDEDVRGLAAVERLGAAILDRTETSTSKQH